jgi:hypothetical protein
MTQGGKYVKKTGLMQALTAVKAPDKSSDRPTARRGKKSDPRFRQISVLVEKDVYLEVRRHLIGAGMDASDLVNSLLQEWLKKQS